MSGISVRTHPNRYICTVIIVSKTEAKHFYSQVIRQYNVEIPVRTFSAYFYCSTDKVTYTRSEKCGKQKLKLVIAVCAALSIH